MRLLIAALVAACISACALGERTAFTAPGTASTRPGLFDPYWASHTGWSTPYAPPINHVAPDPRFGLQTASDTPDWTRPDRDLTPGVARPLSLAEICQTKWGKDHRAVTAAMKRDVFRDYGFTGNGDPRCHGACEIDHLISRELGGADDIENLWPEPYGGPWNAHDKDRIENRLHVEVCAGRLALSAAQAMIRDDWQGAYRTYFGEPAR